MLFNSNTLLAEAVAQTTARQASAEVIQFPASRRRPRALPKLELLTALFGAIGLAGGPASAEALIAIVSGALPDRAEDAVREEVEALLAFYSCEHDGVPAAPRIFDQLGDGRYVLSDGVRGFLA